jgi:hypothetical protein
LWFNDRNKKDKKDRQHNDQNKKDKKDRQHNDQNKKDKKDRQHNDQNKKDKKTNNELQNTTQNTTHYSRTGPVYSCGLTGITIVEQDLFTLVV